MLALLMLAACFRGARPCACLKLGADDIQTLLLRGLATTSCCFFIRAAIARCLFSLRLL